MSSRIAVCFQCAHSLINDHILSRIMSYKMQFLRDRHSKLADHWIPSGAPATATSRPTSMGLKITWWRLLNSTVLFVLGMFKAVSAYLGYSTTPATLDWIVGVVWALTYALSTSCSLLGVWVVYTGLTALIGSACLKSRHLQSLRGSSRMTCIPMEYFK